MPFPSPWYIQTHEKLGRMKELGGTTGVLAGLNLPPGVGELKKGSDPHITAIVWVRGETLTAETETGDLWQLKRNENQTVLTAAIHTLDRNAGPLGRHSGWELEFRGCGQSQGEGCC